MHLLYSRFFTKAMARPRPDHASASRSSALFNQGQILGADGERMSQVAAATSRTPTSWSQRYGADTVRLFLMFMGPWDQGGPWSPTGIGGVHRFLNRVWTLALDPHGTRARRSRRRRAAGRRGRGRGARGDPRGRPPDAARRHRGLRGFHFNTMVAKLMELTNTLFRYRGTAVAGGPAWDEAIAPAAADAGARRRRTSPRSCGPAGWRRPARRGRRSTRSPGPRCDAAADRGVDPRGAGPGQRQGARPGDRAGRVDEAELEAVVLARPKIRGGPGRPDAGPGHPRRRRPAREPRRPRLIRDSIEECAIDGSRRGRCLRRTASPSDTSSGGSGRPLPVESILRRRGPALGHDANWLVMRRHGECGDRNWSRSGTRAYAPRNSKLGRPGSMASQTAMSTPTKSTSSSRTLRFGRSPTIAPESRSESRSNGGTASMET